MPRSIRAVVANKAAATRMIRYRRVGSPAPEEKFNQWEREIGESRPDKFFFPPTDCAEASFLNAAYLHRFLLEYTCHVTTFVSLLLLSSVGQYSMASSSFPLSLPPSSLGLNPQGKHQWSAFASDLSPEEPELRQEAA